MTSTLSIDNLRALAAAGTTYMNILAPEPDALIADLVAHGANLTSKVESHLRIDGRSGRVVRERQGTLMVGHLYIYINGPIEYVTVPDEELPPAEPSAPTVEIPVETSGELAAARLEYLRGLEY